MEDLDPKYTKKCSTITVFSTERGFFREFYESVKESCGEKWIKGEFAKIHSSSAKLVELLEKDESSGPILGTLEHVAPVFKGKDFPLALKKFHEGVRMLQEGNHRNAAILLSQAIIKTTQGTSENEKKFLAEALWKRSEALIWLDEGEKAMQDMKYAIEMGSQVKQSPEYFWRMAKCYIITKDLKKARVSLGLAEKLLKNDPKIQEKIEKEKEELEILENMKNIKIPEKNVYLNTLEMRKEYLKIPDGSSEKLQLTTGAKTGNFFVASADINPGEDVMCESPVAVSLLPEFFGSHCLHCLTRLVAPIACANCCSVAFCSQECRKEACSSYHQFECQYLDLLIGSGMSALSFLALRIVTAAGNYEKAVESTKDLLEGLCRHSEKRTGDDYLQRSLMAIFQMRILQKSGFFGRRTTESVNPTTKELKTAEIILNLLEALQFNAHEIYETLLGTNHIVGSKESYIGVAVYRKASLFNHDCFPSVARYFSGNKLRLTALRSIASGQAVTENYGPVFTKQNLLQRQRNLRSRYWFHCECLSCREDWQKLEDLSNKCRIKCPTDKCDKAFYFPDNPERQIKCTRCKNHVTLLGNVKLVREAEELYRRAAEALDKNEINAAADLFEEGIKLFFTVGIPPHKDTHIAMESLRICYSLRGNVYKK
ncbi:SET and MYND domain-containing protein 4 [Lutzomyia longipalpis]|uniref:SET and MYND domain-containing protein 4 n=1 Tax=Lutzomyia longipalpis TaxID=7200 RepID=UPI002483C344|nr:SET and MYND domain-containing protein 4 [Lutzomyia longipalpis]